MKLLQRTARYYLLLSLAVFSTLGMVLFFLLRFILDHAVDEGLTKTSTVLERQLSRLDSLPPEVEIMDEIVVLQAIGEASDYTRYSDTLLFDDSPDEMEFEPYRKYTYETELKGQAYRVSLHHSKVESDDLILTIFLFVLVAFALVLLALNLLGNYLSRKLWRPFHATLDKVRSFSIQNPIAANFGTSSVNEFNDLNRSLEAMTVKLTNDYKSLRQFTENASHEMQTPLAIMRNQVDLLLTGPERSEEDYQRIQVLSETIARLSKLNQSLLLLTKIERAQYVENEWIDIAPIINKKLDQLAVFINEKDIRQTTEIQPVQLYMNTVLVDVLLNNLIGNAIRHNVAGGRLEVIVDQYQLFIRNTGPELKRSSETLFNRFQKESTLSDSLGLGLAIVREVCDRYGYTLIYNSADGWHEVKVLFNTAK
ncbi:hypothetical protein CEQ90_02680 [Lewinellaceae bacterium SD302]|nr:hypothetical protein CEQ90_02680 [Lewinellaceae bacterium SD302]